MIDGPSQWQSCCLRSGTWSCNSHYNGIASVQAYDVTGAAVQVEVVQPASAGAVAYAMLSVGTTSSDFYRYFVSGETLVAARLN